MTKLTLTITDANNEVRTDDSGKTLQAEGEGQVYLSTQSFLYQDGDRIQITTDQQASYLMAQLDETLAPTLIYLKEQKWTYLISMQENAKEARPDNRFANQRHYLSVRPATEEEVSAYRNLALNPHDQKEFAGAYPHAHANVETRNDATFFACNAIDGVFANCLHGSYPYQSWGINQQADAALTIDFGRNVELDKAVLTLRADFPHDNYWQEVTLSFSDGSKEVLHTKKTAAPQSFSFAKRQAEWVTLSDLKQSAEPSPFPALTEIELFGRNI